MGVYPSKAAKALAGQSVRRVGAAGVGAGDDRRAGGPRPPMIPHSFQILMIGKQPALQGPWDCSFSSGSNPISLRARRNAG